MDIQTFYKSIITINLVMMYLLIALSDYGIALVLMLSSPAIAIGVCLSTQWIEWKYDRYLAAALTLSSMLHVLAVIASTG